MPIFNGDGGNNNLVGTAQADELYGQGGDDTLNALTRPTAPNSFTDYVDGGLGIDTLIVNASGETGSVNLSTGGAIADVRSVSGNFFVDSDNIERVNFTGGSGADSIQTSQMGGAINGGAGIDWWQADLSHLSANVTFRLGATTAISAAGLTSITNIERLTLYTGNGNDIVDGGAQADDIRTGGGNDAIDLKTRPTAAGSGSDYADGGTGIDTLIVNAQNETQAVQLSRGGSVFDVRSDSGNFFVDSDNMELIRFTGGSGADLIQTVEAGGTIDGGGGIDWWQADLSAVGEAMTFILGTTTAIAAAGLTSITNIERLTLYTGSGNDIVDGGAQADDIRTGGGNDAIDLKTRPTAAGSGSDYADGGTGIDTLIVNAQTETQAVQLSRGGSVFDVRSDSGNFFIDSDNMEMIRFTGGSGADFIQTGEAGGTIDGGGGIDWWQADLSAVDESIIFILGSTTAITPAGLTSILGLNRISLITGDGNDTITGGTQADDIRTGNGNDTIDLRTRPTVAGSGTDYADGGAGIDTLIVNAASETQRVELSSSASTFDVRSTSGRFFIDSDGMEIIRFTGGSAADYIQTGQHGGTIDGGAEIDWWVADLSHLSTDVTFRLGTTTAIAAAGLTSITNIERLNLNTGSGNDIVDGGAQEDDIRTGAGNDTIDLKTRPTAATSGIDYADGGSGIDTLIVNAETETQAVQLFRGGATFDVRSDSGNFFIDSDSMEIIQFTGGSGADLINTGEAGGTIDGGGGIDWWQADLSAVGEAITFVLGSTTAIAPAGLTSILGLNRINLITGDGNDTISGGTQADDIRTGNGNDTIDLRTRPTAEGSGTDYADGGTGIDTLIVNAASESKRVELTSSGSTFDVRSTSGRFFIDSDNMEIIRFTGGAIADYIQTGQHGGTIDGGPGSDWWVADLSHLTTNVTFRLGSTTAISAAGLTSITNIERLHLNTGSGNDIVDGGERADDIRTGDGNDTINLKTRTGPTDYADGGSGIDTLIVDAENETQAVQLFRGGSIFDVRSDSGNFFIDSDNMEIIQFTGGSGADLIQTGEAGGTIDGGAGIDWWQADLSAVGEAITFILGSTTAIAPAGLTSILGLNRISLITGGGNDTITGGTQADDVRTGNGNDTIDLRTRPTVAGSGTDYADGGAGIDTLIVNAASETERVELFSSGSIFDVRSTSGRFFVDSDNMEIVRFTGGAGGDLAEGLSLADLLTGGTGADTLFGEGGNDTLSGGNDNDTLTGGTGADRLTGGSSADVFDYDEVSESGFDSASRDSVTDFQVGVDEFNLASIDANGNSADGNQAFIFIGSSAFSGVRGQLRSIAGRFEADVDGDSVFDFRVSLTNSVTAAAGDFIL